eukprot:1175604-Prorocentrum_minimum.AAC.2
MESKRKREMERKQLWFNFLQLTASDWSVENWSVEHIPALPTSDGSVMRIDLRFLHPMGPS